MQRNVIAVLFSLVSLMFTSCQKMVFSNGEPITEERSVDESFTVVSMFNNVNVKLVHSQHPRLELTCPKNLIEKVTTEVKGDTLVVRNENDFNWIRSYDYSIDLTVYYDSLRSVNFYSIGTLQSLDSLRGMSQQSIDSTESGIDTVMIRGFILRVLEGSGDIDLTLSCNVLKAVFSNGTSKVTLHGYAGYAEHYLRSYGTIHAEDLYSNIVKVTSNSTNDAYVWAHSSLFAYLSNIGNVYYRGYPWIAESYTGDGRVIKLE